MKLASTERIRDQAARAEAWKRYAFRQSARAEEFEARWQDAEMYAIRSEAEVTREVQREMDMDAREEASGAYAEGYWKGREDSGEGGW